jgi:hypothetical protein
MSNQQNPTTVTTGDVRLSYAHVFTPYAKKPGDEPKYSVTILIPKSDVSTKQRIDAAINVAIQFGVANKWNGVRPAQVNNPVWDGDGLRKGGDPFPAECKGHWVLAASSKQQPGVFDLNLNPIINQSEVYSGVYARVNVNFFPYFNSGNKGIGCGLNLIQKRADGEPLAGNRISAEDAFGDGFPAFQPQQPAYQPQQPAQYQQSYQPTVAPTPATPPYPQQYNAPASYPAYQTPAAPPYPQQYNAPAAAPTAAPPQVDPITGRPIVGQILGINN